MVAVSFMMNLDHAAIQAHQSLADWISWYNREHDAFTDRPTVTWDDVYAAIAADFFSGGEWSQFVISWASTIGKPHPFGGWRTS
jgi:hypothetical protein